MKLELPWEKWIENVMQIIKDHDPEFFIKHPPEADFINNLVFIATELHGPALKEKIDAYSQQFESTELTGAPQNPELIEFIRQHHQEYAIFLWTSNLTTTVKPILEDLEILPHFKKVIGRETVKQLKPARDGFDLIQIDFPFELSEFLMIGDSDADKGAAETVGIDFFRVNFFKKEWSEQFSN